MITDEADDNDSDDKDNDENTFDDNDVYVTTWQTWPMLPPEGGEKVNEKMDRGGRRWEEDG